MFHYLAMYIFYYNYSTTTIIGITIGEEREEKQEVQSPHLAPWHLHPPFYNCYAG